MKNELLENLKPTFKAYGIVWTGLSAKILIDCYRNNDYSDAIDIFYFLSFVPVIAFKSAFKITLKCTSFARWVANALRLRYYHRSFAPISPSRYTSPNRAATQCRLNSAYMALITASTFFSRAFIT